MLHNSCGVLPVPFGCTLAGLIESCDSTCWKVHLICDGPEGRVCASLCAVVSSADCVWGSGWGGFQVLQVAGLLLVFERVQVKGSVQEASQLHQVSFLVSCCRGRCRLSSGVPGTCRSEVTRGTVTEQYLTMMRSSRITRHPWIC